MRVAALALCLLLASCANQRSVYRQPKLGESSLVVDAKARIVSSRTGTQRDQQPPGPVLCAEPSPDALSALTTSLATSGSYKDKLSAATNLSMSEAAGSIGLRTQSIQLMRDAMYRLCEGYSNGSLTREAFETLHRRFQSSMVAILAIEQLTGVTRAPAVLIGGKSSAGDPAAVAKITEETQQKRLAMNGAKTALDTAQKSAEAAKAKLDGAVKDRDTFLAANPAATDAAKKPFQDKVDAATQENEPAAQALVEAKNAYDMAKSVYDQYEAARITALAGGSSADSTALRLDGGATNPSADTVSKLAESVQEIVKNTLELSFTRELCTTVLIGTGADRSPITDAQARQNVQVASSHVTQLQAQRLVKTEAARAASTDEGRKRLSDEIALLDRQIERARQDEAALAKAYVSGSAISGCLRYLDASVSALQEDRQLQFARYNAERARYEMELAQLRSVAAPQSLAAGGQRGPAQSPAAAPAGPTPPVPTPSIAPGTPPPLPQPPQPPPPLVPSR